MNQQVEQRRKPRLLIIGYAEHGKDTVAQMISDIMGLKFTSSSVFVGEEVIWPMWGKSRYASFDEMFADRVNYRDVWFNLIAAYNTPDKTRTATEMLNLGNDMYVGMRSEAEWNACLQNKVFDHVIWVDASKRKPIEPKTSNQLTPKHANLLVDNNGPESNLQPVLENLQKLLHDEGYDVGYQEQAPAMDTVINGPEPEEDKSQLQKAMEFMTNYEPEAPELGKRLEWTDKPANAITVLDHGFFEVKEVMGSDTEIAESARMSYGRGTKKVNNNAGLINYLVRNHHTSPLEMGEIRFHMRLPIFVMRQLVRHRTANLNEYSGRYSEMVRLFYCPELAQIMCQSDGPNKQMSGEPLPEEEAKAARQVIKISSNRSFDDYEDLLERNVSRETARIVLPLNTYTECVWKMDVSNLIKFLYLRDDDHAQYEIRVYAQLIAEAVEKFFPNVYAAYMRERASLKLTPLQIESLVQGEFHKDLSKSETAQLKQILEDYS